MSFGRLMFALLSLELCVILHCGQAVLGDDAERIQRQRHQEYIDRIAKETIEQTAQHLNLHEDMVVRARIHPYDADPQLEFVACLADRRLARLYGHLETLPRKEADQFCRRLFDEKLERQKADFTGIMEAYKRGRPPTYPSPFTIGENWHALNVCVFLSAAYCPIDETLRQVDAWSELRKTFVLDVDFASLTDNREHQAALRVEFRQCADPQPLFLFTLYAHMLQDRGALTKEELAGICPNRSMSRDLELKAHLVRWNSIPESTPPGRLDVSDNVHDRPYVIRTYTPFRSWYQTRSPEQRTAAVTELRSRLMVVHQLDP